VATTVKLKVRKPSKEREAEDTFETVQEIVAAIGEGIFDPYIDVIFKAFDERIRKSQEEDGDGELPTRERSEKLRPMRAEREAIIPVEGRHYRLRGEKYKGAVVMYIEMAGFNSRGAALVLVEAITNNDIVTTGQRYKVPLLALEEIPDMKSKPLPNISDTPKCRKCGEPVKYSGRGRPRSFCDNCLKTA
jgi:hypothetical protein